MPLVKVNDIEIYTEIHGDGPNLLLVAGLGGRHEFWANQVEALSKHFRVILHDHRGVGKSTPDKLVAGAEHMADDLISLMDVLDVEKAHLIGHSTGGAIGQHIALKAPERIDKLVLSSSWAGPDAYFTQLFSARREVLINAGPNAYLTMGTFLATPAWHLQPQIKSTRSFLEDRIKAFPGLEVELSRLAAVAAHDLRTHIQHISHETLAIGAKDDQITPFSFTEELSQKIPNAKLKMLDYGGHFAPMTVSEKYNHAVIEFLHG
ncbi:alpha/beta fold hydrolase [Aliiglaciecola sp. SL4]|uniref:alpha/beta fold hydrolase n=1 Tax=Aliiglaciecola sp. SL4 TaxID=3239806 RepID=UPI00355B636F